MPSRKTVALIEQEERDRLLIEAANKGYVTNYTGVRTSSSGKRFHIKDVLLWNVLDDFHQKCGQAATFSSYQFINS